MPYDGKFDRLHPEELKVSLQGKEIIVRGRHGGFGSQEKFFMSHFPLPEGVDKYSIRCDLDEKGRLQIYGQIVEKRNSDMWEIPFEMDEDLEKEKNEEVPMTNGWFK